MRLVIRLIVSLAAIFCFVLPTPAQTAGLDEPVEQPGSGLYTCATTLSRLLQEVFILPFGVVRDPT